VSHFISQAYRVVIIDEPPQRPQRPQLFVSKNRHRLSIFPLDPSFPWVPLNLCQASAYPHGVSSPKTWARVFILSGWIILLSPDLKRAISSIQNSTAGARHV